MYLDEPVKIGRSVARCRPAQNNATFDCKVLSRNHALVWFDHKTGKVRGDDDDRLTLINVVSPQDWLPTRISDELCGKFCTFSYKSVFFF